MTDNGYPNPQSDTATAIITIDRDLNVPVFTSNARYAVTIDETTNIGSSILNVQASRLNLVVFTFIKDTPYGKLINLSVNNYCMYLNFELSRDVFTMNQLEIIQPRVSSWYRTPVVPSVSPRICVKTTCVWTPTWWDFDSSYSFFLLDLNILHCFI